MIRWFEKEQCKSRNLVKVAVAAAGFLFLVGGCGQKTEEPTGKSSTQMQTRGAAPGEDPLKSPHVSDFAKERIKAAQARGQQPATTP